MNPDQRRQLAGQLHDGPVQELTVARLRVELLRQRAADGPWSEDLQALDESLTAAAKELRRIMSDLTAASAS
jgi:signal transduction histidine kinase